MEMITLGLRIAGGVDGKCAPRSCLSHRRSFAQGVALGLGHCARRLPTRYALTRPCVSATVSVLVLTLIIMVLVLYFTCTFNESTARFRHIHAPLVMHPLQAPLDIHPRHSPSASTLFMMVLVLYFMIFATVVVVLLLLLLLVVVVVLLLFLTPG